MIRVKSTRFLIGTTNLRFRRGFILRLGLRLRLKIRNFLKYQPIISSKTGKVESFEALVRWNSEKYGEIIPDEFIPVAEKSQDIVELGYYVLENACSFIRDYNNKCGVDLKVSINVSVLQLLKGDFVEQVAKKVRLFNLAPRNIIIEITESLLLDSNDFAKRQIVKLRNMGFSVSLDDFGTGYSSLNIFFSMPFTQLKIDKQVVSKAMNSREAWSYISFLAGLCYERNIKVVAEGIENEEMEKEMKQIGLELLQGYFYSKPVYEQEAYALS